VSGHQQVDLPEVVLSPAEVAFATFGASTACSQHAPDPDVTDRQAPNNRLARA
jgi:hypothetical protein